MQFVKRGDSEIPSRSTVMAIFYQCFVLTIKRIFDPCITCKKEVESSHKAMECNIPICEQF